MRGTNTGPSMAHKFVSAAVLAEVCADHLWLNLNSIERLAVVDTNYRSNHLWNDNHLLGRAKSTIDKGSKDRKTRNSEQLITSPKNQASESQRLNTGTLNCAFQNGSIQNDGACASRGLVGWRKLTFRKCVLTTSGFSCSGASFLALLSFLINAIGFLVIPRLNFLRAREESSGRSSTGFIVSKASRSTPRKVNFLKVLRFG